MTYPVLCLSIRGDVRCVVMRTKRVSDSTPIDEDALHAMRALLEKWGGDEIAKRQLETDAQGLGKRITLKTTFNNADEVSKLL